MTSASDYLARIRRINKRLQTATGPRRKRLLNKRADAVIDYIKALRPKLISTSFLKSLLL